MSFLFASFTAVMRCALLATAIIASTDAFAAAPLRAFDFDDVAARARQLAARGYERPPELAKELQSLNYEQYNDIRYRPDRFRWRGAAPFELAFFHRGFTFQTPVKINEVSAEGVQEIKFNSQDFDYGANKLPPAALKDAGFAGFRVHYPLNTPKVKDELLVFLGATYFRALGKGQVYGASARGLAINTALAAGEEFPLFTEFWIQRPAPTARELTIYGLMDSKSVTGAYRFVLKPGAETTMDVKLQLYFRDSVGKVGLAPLTSM